MRLYLRLLRLGRGEAPWLLGASVARLAAAAGDLLLIALARRLVDVALAGGGARLLAPALAATLLVVSREGLAYAGHLLSARATTRLVADFQERLFRHTHALPLRYFLRASPGDLVSRLFHDTTAAALVVTETTAAAVESPLRLIGLVVLLWTFHPALALATVAVIAPGLLGIRLFTRRLRARFRDVNEDLGALYAAAYDSLAGAEVVKTAGAEASEADAFAARARALVRRQVALEAVQGLGSPLGEMLRLAAVAVLLGLGARLAAAGELGPGALVATLGAAYAFLGSLQALAGTYSGFQQGLAAAERVVAVLDEPVAGGRGGGGRAATFREALVFEDVSFAYPAGRRALDGLSLTIRPGERVAIVGQTGSGKTTLLRLLVRTLEATDGHVTFDGVDVRALDGESLLALFAVVPQDAWVFDRSLRDNVILGRPGATDDDVRRALAVAGLQALVAALPAGLDTRVGPRGVALSGGERQRLGLARAVLRDAPILLLDEATSALDAATEAAIQRALRARSIGQTTITVAHRGSTVRRADRVIVLQAGRVVREIVRRAGVAAGRG